MKPQTLPAIQLMIYQTYKNRRIIWGSKATYLAVAIGSFIFLALSIYFYKEFSGLMFWGSVFLFGGGGVITLIQLLDPKNLIVSANSDLGRAISAEIHRKEIEHLGSIVCSEDGFSVSSGGAERTFPWSAIDSVFVYKVDLVTTDEVCLDIFIDGESMIMISESTPGWDSFTEEMKQNFSTVLQNWEQEIWQPPFETKLTLLFDRQGRSQQAVEKSCYKN